MRTMTRHAGWLVIYLLLWSSPPAAADLYHWTDAQGVRHFSNTPPPEGADATVLLEEIPYDPESDDKRRTQEDAMLRESESAETQARLEKAERDAEEARRQAEAARAESENRKALQQAAAPVGRLQPLPECRDVHRPVLEVPGPARDRLDQPAGLWVHARLQLLDGLVHGRRRPGYWRDR